MRLSDRLSASLANDIDGLLIGDDTAPETDDITPAAVLVAVVDRIEPTVLLTVRTDTLRHHAGQIAFPGGRLEPGETPVEAALREAEEEVGLLARDVNVIGCADGYRTVTGFAVTPVLAIIPPGLPLHASDGEVADLFEVPLAFLIDRANHATRTMDWQGVPRSYFEIAWRNRRIWGATAAMIVNLSRRLERVA